MQVAPDTRKTGPGPGCAVLNQMKSSGFSDIVERELPAVAADMQELHAQRLNRYVTAMRNGRPDRVPIRPFAAEFTARHCGMTAQQVTHDYRQAFEAVIRCCRDYDWDAAVPNMVYVWTGLVQAAGLRYYAIPGIDVDEHTGFQYREPDMEHAWMRREEYDEFIEDPVAFLWTKWLPRISAEYEKSPMRRDLALFKDIYNQAWDDNWGFVPLSDAELDALIRDLGQYLEPRLAFFAEVRGEPAAFLLAFPDLNQPLHAAYPRPGKPTLLTLAQVFWHWKIRSKITRVRIALMGVREHFRGIGVEAAMFAHFFEQTPALSAETGWTYADAGWVLETNESMNRIVRAYGGDDYKHYRWYERALR